jgi:hypothetical protein
MARFVKERQRYRSQDDGIGCVGSSFLLPGQSVRGGFAFPFSISGLRPLNRDGLSGLEINTVKDFPFPAEPKQVLEFKTVGDELCATYNLPIAFCVCSKSHCAPISAKMAAALSK